MNCLFYCRDCFGLTTLSSDRVVVPCEHCGGKYLYTIHHWPGWSDYDRWFMAQVGIQIPPAPIPPARTTRA